MMMESLGVFTSAYALIFLAEMGDKSQLVVMTLAARHRPTPVVIGATVAFALLNLLAVVFGAGVAAWLPEHWVSAAVAVLFLVFGIQALRAGEEEETVDTQPASGRSLFVTAFMLIFVAEFGDKTQIAVAGLAGTVTPWMVWVGATLALLSVSALGALMGQALLKRISVVWVHRAAGAIFLAMALFAGYRALALAAAG